jgi:hypothetical protein
MTEQEELAGIAVLLKDRAWRLDNFYLILDEEAGIVPFVARAEQRQFRQNRHFRNFVPKARKLGISTEIVIENLDDCLFTPNLTAGIIDLKEGDAQAKLQIARTAWECGPSHPNPGIAKLWRSLHAACPLISDNGGAMEWANGSAMEAGTSFTGRTPQRMHISEYGPIASQKPNKAAQIQRGSINAVPPGGIVDIETTMEGGRFGLCYHYFQLSKEACGKDLSPADWRLHFFSWTGHPSYRLKGRKAQNAETFVYFHDLLEQYGVTVDDEQMAWYESRRRELADEIWQQYPTVIDECDKALVIGAIYPEMGSVRLQGRVRDFPLEIGVPTFTFWDLGSSDNMAGWLIQPAGKDINVYAFCCGEGAGAAGVAEVIRSWEREHGPIAGHFLPHDANITDKGSGLTYLKQLIASGIPAHIITVVPRTPDVWAGISEVRKRIPRMWFHSRCDKELTVQDGQKFPGGVGRLEGYRKGTQSSTGIVRQMPHKDGVCDHAADALRTFAEADALGRVFASTQARASVPTVKLYKK